MCGKGRFRPNHAPSNGAVRFYYQFPAYHGLSFSQSMCGVLTDHNTTKVGGLSYARFYKKSAGLSSQFRLFVTIEAVNFVAGA